MFLTVREAAALLKTTERQVYRWVDAAAIPFQKLREQVRFNQTDLLEWATARRIPVALEAFDAQLAPEDRSPSLAEALRLGGVHQDVPALDRDAALRELVGRTPLPETLDREFVLEVLLARENTVSTSIADGIAIPHVRQPVVAPGAKATVTVAYLTKPVPFGEPGEAPIHTLLFIVSPTVRAHLQVLAQVARALLDPAFRAAVDRRAGADELAALAGQLESSARPPSRPGAVEP